jgi:hypothetical protein
MFYLKITAWHIITALIIFSGIIFMLTHPNITCNCQTDKTIFLDRSMETLQNKLHPAHSNFDIAKLKSILNKNEFEYGNLWGASMEPTFWDGNTAIMIPYNKNKYNLTPGEIIRYYEDNNAVIHRITAIYPDGIMVDGDNMLVSTPPIQKNQITHIIIGIIFT